MLGFLRNHPRRSHLCRLLASSPGALLLIPQPVPLVHGQQSRAPPALPSVPNPAVEPQAVDLAIRSFRRKGHR